MATFFIFLGQLFGEKRFELFARETNLKKQSSVCLTEDFQVLRSFAYKSESIG